jgi:hypothetical protein
MLTEMPLSGRVRRLAHKPESSTGLCTGFPSKAAVTEGMAGFPNLEISYRRVRAHARPPCGPIFAPMVIAETKAGNKIF